MLESAAFLPAGQLRADYVRLYEQLPRRFVPFVEKKWMSLYHQAGDLRGANAMLLDAIESLGQGRANVAANDDELRAFAKARAEECSRAATPHIADCFARPVSDEEILSDMESIAYANGITPPDAERYTPQGRRARLLCVKWWTRAVRRHVARRVEKAAIDLGLVHRRAGLYASHETVARRIGQKRRNRAMLEATRAVNEQGQEYNMAELSDLGVSNPEKRRLELMTRLAGFDLIAQAMQHAGEFYTWTAPSKYHARDAISGRENPKYNGATPRATQNYISKLWRQVRAKLHRENIRVYGFRVAEPHHDGTPHWHMILFMEPQHVARVRAIMREYAMREDGNEKGADQHRFKAEAIDWKKGSAVGYLAKYIAKNIDGHAVGDDWEAVEGKDDAKKTAKRVDAWASTWGIRQFQQIGGAPVTVWRELRRLKKDDANGLGYLEALIEAADSANWQGYTQLMGGPMARRDAMPVHAWSQGGVDLETGEMSFNAYGEIAAPRILGVEGFGEQLLSRVHEWKFERVGATWDAATPGFKQGVLVSGKAASDYQSGVVFQRDGAAVTPWSSVNNCTGEKHAGTYRTLEKGGRGGFEYADGGPIAADFEGQHSGNRRNPGGIESGSGRHAGRIEA